MQHPLLVKFVAYVDWWLVWFYCRTAQKLAKKHQRKKISTSAKQGLQYVITLMLCVLRSLTSCCHPGYLVVSTSQFHHNCDPINVSLCPTQSYRTIATNQTDRNLVFRVLIFLRFFEQNKVFNQNHLILADGLHIAVPTLQNYPENKYNCSIRKLELTKN